MSGDAQKQATGRANFLVAEEPIDISEFKPTPPKPPAVSAEIIRAVSVHSNFPDREPTPPMEAARKPVVPVAKPAPRPATTKPRLTVHAQEGRPRRFRTNRNAQVNIKAEEEVRDRFNTICDRTGLVGGELLKHLLELYEKSVAEPNDNPKP
jgi:hypothetical protein